MNSHICFSKQKDPVPFQEGIFYPIGTRLIKDGKHVWTTTGYGGWFTSLPWAASHAVYLEMIGLSERLEAHEKKYCYKCGEEKSEYKALSVYSTYSGLRYARPARISRRSRASGPKGRSSKYWND